jgi:hypothetical protein
VKGDVRGYRVAVVADSLLDRLLPLLEEEQWGAIQLPPPSLDAETVAAWLEHVGEHVGEHVAEFRRNGYAVILLDDGAHELSLDVPTLRASGDVGEARSFLRQEAIQPPSTSRLTPDA